MAAAKIPRRAIAAALADRLAADPSSHAHWMEVLAAYLVEHGQAALASQVVNDIAHELYVRHGSLQVSVRSARPLTDQLRDQLTTYLVRETAAREVVLHESIEPELIGGLVARTPDGELDLSVRHTLKQLEALGGTN